MTYKVTWSPLAKETYLKILEYVLSKWNKKEVVKVVFLINKKIKNLEKNLLLCPASTRNKTIRKYIVSMQTSLLYQVKDNAIELLLFIDNRADIKH